jgi:hypothetical protein
VFHAEGVELKRHAGMAVMHHLRRMRLIEGILIEIRIMIGVVGYHDAVHGWHLGGEVRWSLPGLFNCQFSYRRWRFKKQS